MVPTPRERRDSRREAVNERASTKPLTVDLYVCPECHLVGKRPVSDIGGSIKGYCKGPFEAPHRKRKMELRRFEEMA